MSLPPSAQRVQDAARGLGLDVEVREMAQPTRTAEDAATACGVTPQPQKTGTSFA